MVGLVANDDDAMEVGCVETESVGDSIFRIFVDLGKVLMISCGRRLRDGFCVVELNLGGAGVAETLIA